MMRTLDIGIDLDGVCFDFIESLRRYLLTQGYSRDQLPDPTCWHFYREQWGLSLYEFLAACNAAADAGVLFTNVDPYPSTRETLVHFARRGHRIHIVTDRSFGAYPLVSQNNTLRWLCQHGIPYDSLTFSGDKTVVATDIFLDDRPENYDALNDVGCWPWLMDRPWNRWHPGRRVHSWREFADMVARLAEVAA